MMNLIEGVIKPLHTGPGPSEWASKAFPVHKGNGTSVCIVSDSKKLNRQIKHPNWPTESSDQLLLHIDPRARHFFSMDLTCGYHQIPIDDESQNLLVISTTMGRYRFIVLAHCPRSMLSFRYL